ncbi:Bifunctional inhibitor/lipid-transfer protein/seed storage 2S albumin superfamily protein [Theobroma cacao]|uniref:Bifunctional inhibitor/lipid-transfer protein/seed storage 2S albumin superfamily protein n=1 Tax=Theobroma cacao TaxID=3641 RepID=A0A061G044_THECC|nr:Bifunctional inhibitor/lipid-transfer protein/seed storage 2S albumin superfamily protein [Theobroma cacao]
MASSRCGVGLFILVLVVAGVFEVPVARGAMSPSQCKEEQRLLVSACRSVLSGRSPSPSCCQRIRVTHVECVCPVVTPKLAALIGVERTIKQIEGCGRVVPHKFKCGSITTP